MTPITPACTGSLTTRSAAAGTDPGHVQADDQDALGPDLLDRRRDVPADERAGQDEGDGARQAAAETSSWRAGRTAVDTSWRL